MQYFITHLFIAFYVCGLNGCIFISTFQMYFDTGNIEFGCLYNTEMHHHLRCDVLSVRSVLEDHAPSIIKVKQLRMQPPIKEEHPSSSNSPMSDANLA
jgi:hypothetical protein